MQPDKIKSRLSLGEFVRVDPEQTLSNVFQWLFTFCAIAHCVYLFCFAFMKITPLAVFNVVSIAIYLLCFFLTKRRKMYMLVFVAFFEVIVFAVTAVAFFGWGMQFQVLIIALIPCTFFFPFKHLSCPLTLGIISVVIYTGLSIYSGLNAPLWHDSDFAVWLTVLRYSNVIVSMAVILALSFLFGTITRKNQSRLRRANIILRDLANTDPLTGLVNRRSMDVEMERAIHKVRSGGGTSVVVIGDIDNFKAINDTYGHSFGDEVLINVAKSFRESISPDDVICRWGGEEILVLLKETTIEDAKKIITVLGNRIASTPHLYKDKDVHITMTYGMSLIDVNTSYDQAISQADSRLYVGKRQGKNCIIV